MENEKVVRKIKNYERERETVGVGARNKKWKDARRSLYEDRMNACVLTRTRHVILKTKIVNG